MFSYGRLLQLATSWILGICSLASYAADHVDAPGTMNAPASDITDVFLFRGDAGKLVGSICFGGQPAPRPLIMQSYFDSDVIYIYPIDTDGDVSTAEFEIY